MVEIKIVTLSPTLTAAEEAAPLLEAFARLNLAWIRRYFRVEPSDVKLLTDPRKHILERGGYIFVALADGEPAGCCALIPHPGKAEWELAKMAVDPARQGHGIGGRLGEALKAKAEEMGVPALFLEGNTQLEASIRLYRRLGFEAVADYVPAYERCNIFMICKLPRNIPSSSQAASTAP